MKPILVMTSCGTRKDAELISRKILELKLAACVQITPSVTSRYWWHGKIEDDNEYVLTLKSMRCKFELLSQEISKIHPYDVPEVIATDITAISKPYFEWLSKELDLN